MFSIIKKNIKLPSLAALIIMLCAVFCGCAKQPQSSNVSKANKNKPVSSASTTSSKAVSSKAAVSKASSSNSASKASLRQSSNSSPVKKTPVLSASSSAQYSKYVTLTIDARKSSGGSMVANGKKVGINAGDTVFTVLKRYCDTNKIILAAQNTGNGEYVSSIDGAAQFNNGPQSGWIYSVGGVFPGKDCNSFKLSGGENIKWIYTTDLGKSEGATK